MEAMRLNLVLKIAGRDIGIKLGKQKPKGIEIIKLAGTILSIGIDLELSRW